MNKILILGSSGTGKTTLARTLSKKLKITALHLDSVYWEKNWRNIGKDEFDKKMKSFLKNNQSWVIDGNYLNNSHFKYRLDLADTIIYLDYGVSVALKGIFQRASKYRHQVRSDMASGCVEGIDQDFLKYVAKFSDKGKMIKAIIKKYENKKRVLIFNSRKELSEFINTL
ncbi:hypothetical protein CI105_04845 [Candidatus Izimaplasma bacterium ZiA1]|uniref:AAA family ATPase n=1 Tax=Candidatus Izimoplasma sp. ZiA1 TaxID=2024899 RepID=UPI000BAA88C7|nr:hypothetical protein CI105_04845 [Candidatus Izimaplasma bacterium ZiA1]